LIKINRVGMDAGDKPHAAEIRSTRRFGRKPLILVNMRRPRRA